MYSNSDRLGTIRGHGSFDHLVQRPFKVVFFGNSVRHSLVLDGFNQTLSYALSTCFQSSALSINTATSWIMEMLGIEPGAVECEPQTKPRNLSDPNNSDKNQIRIELKHK